MVLHVKHIQDHPSGRKSFRRAYPPHLHRHLGGTQLRVSLGRPEEPGFLSRYEKAAAQWTADVETAERQHAGAFDPLGPAMLAYLGKAFEVDWLRSEEDKRKEGRDGWAALVAGGWEDMLDDFRRWYAEGDADEAVEFWGKSAHQLLAAEGLLVDPANDDQFGRLCLELNEAAIRVSDVSLARLRGKPVPTPEMPERPEAATASTTSPKVPLKASYEAYATEAEISSNHRAEARTYLGKLVTFLGHDDASKITAENVVEWKDQLLAEPKRDGGKRSAVTVNDKYLSVLKATLEWLKDQRKLKENVARGIRARVRKKPKLRERAFTRKESLAILTATLVPASSRMSPGNQLARRWIPWLCAYTGARVGEMAQLRREDVFLEDRVWVLKITPEAGSVKTNEYRIVPIHEHLIAQGFLKIVQEASGGPLFYDPSMRRTSDDDGEGNRHIKKVGERLAKWVRDDVGIKDPNIQPNHAWRHTFKTDAVELGILARTSDAITGHAVPKGEVGRTYEEGTLKAKVAAIAKFPRHEVPGM
jgi:integrase